MIQCPSCRSQVEDDSQFCDQCAERLSPAESPADAEGPGRCPDCGGEVKDLGQGRGECSDCGIRLDEAPAEYSESAEALMFKNLSESVHGKLQCGSALETALAQSCAELGLRLAYAARESPAAIPGANPAPVNPAEEASGPPCPVCSAGNRPESDRCRECGVYFKNLRSMECPRCFRDCSESLCSCGAILTVPRLMELFDASIQSICKRCKQLYSASRPSCADCAGPLVSAETLKKRWKTR